jgi:membrane associated rhomboid family serine protease
MSIRYESKEEAEPGEEGGEVEEGEGGESAETAVAVPRVTPYYTYALLACIISVSLFQLAIGWEKSADIAAFDKDHFRNGEYWRILTGAALHLYLVHILLNAYALYSFGRLVELLTNRAHLPVIFLLSAIGGNILSIIFIPEGGSAGASGGIVGLLGYLVVYSFRRRQFLAPAFIKNLLINTGILIVFGLALYQVIDNFGHLGGFLTGAAYALILVPGDPYKDPREAGGIASLAGLVAFGIFAATSIFSILLITGVVR